jgi:hypothetical protein
VCQFVSSAQRVWRFTFRLRVEKRNQHAAFLGFRSAEERERILREGERGAAHAALDHVATSDGSGVVFHG